MSDDITKRIAAAEELGWYNVTYASRVMGTVPGPAGFPPKGTIVQTLPSLAVLEARLEKKRPAPADPEKTKDCPADKRMPREEIEKLRAVFEKPIDDSTCPVCDGGPGNNCACSCHPDSKKPI